MPHSPQIKPRYAPEQRQKKKGLIMVHTGDGKGKTTAALGVAFRAAGNGMKVAVIQFIKGNWKYGELNAGKAMNPSVEIYPMGEGFTWDTQDRARDIQKTREAWDLCVEKMMSKSYDVVVFDEINYVIDYDYLPVQLVVEALQKKPEMVHVILTGRNARKEIIDAADLVTEMKEIKHPFRDQGILAQRGIEF